MLLWPTTLLFNPDNQAIWENIAPSVLFGNTTLINTLYKFCQSHEITSYFTCIPSYCTKRLELQIQKPSNEWMTMPQGWNPTGRLEYALKFISHPGLWVIHDTGAYWNRWLLTSLLLPTDWMKILLSFEPHKPHFQLHMKWIHINLLVSDDE